MNKRKKKNMLIGVLFTLILFIGIGYAAMYQALNINGTASVESWKIEITGVSENTKAGNAYAISAPSFTATTVTLDAGFVTPGDTITYAVPMENKGSIDAELKSIVVSDKDSDEPIDVEVTGVTVNSTLASGDSTTAYIKLTYNANATGTETADTRNVSVTFNYEQI